MTHESKVHRISAHISPAVKASERVVGNPNEPEKRTSIDSNHREHNAVEAERQAVDPITRWTTANRVG
jgi:hypothetical protein